MPDLKALRSRCFPEDGPKTPPTPQEVEDLIGAVEVAHKIIHETMFSCVCCGEKDLDEMAEWLARFK